MHYFGFTNFCNDVGPRPSMEYTLDRIDNEKGYEPSNCRWVTWNFNRSHRRKKPIIEKPFCWTQKLRAELLSAFGYAKCYGACKQVYPLSNFHKGSYYGRCQLCKSCNKIRASKYFHKKNPEWKYRQYNPRLMLNLQCPSCQIYFKTKDKDRVCCSRGCANVYRSLPVAPDAA
jgi:hypothetical protein